MATRVSPDEAKRRMDDEGYVYVDVRTEAEWAAGHPAGAENVPVMLAGASGMEPNPAFLDVMSAIHPKDAKLVVGCRSGQRSLRAADLLAKAGFTNVVDQRAGFDGARDAFGGVAEPGWQAQGLPVERETPGRSYAELRARAGR